MQIIDRYTERPHSRVMLTPGAAAPIFQLPRLSDGKPFYLQTELEKGPVVLVFFKADCPTCEFTLPLLDRAFRSSSGPHGQMLFVFQEMPLVAQGMIETFNVHAPVVVDEYPHRLSEAFGISFVPSAFYINRLGIVESVAESFDRETLACMAEDLARENGFDLAPFYELGENVPVFRPGCASKNAA